MTTPMPINLDKLRNAVQKFGGMSFTTSQVAADYYQGESTVTDQNVLQFDALLQRHAALLGITAQPSGTGSTDTVWQAH